MATEPTQAPHLFPSYASVSAVANTTDPYGPQSVLQNGMMSALNPTGIVYVTNMVSQQVRQHEREVEMIPILTQPYSPWVKSLVFSPNFRVLKFKMFNGIRNPIHITYFISFDGPLQMVHRPQKMHCYCKSFYNRSREQPYMVYRSPRELQCQLARDETEVRQIALQHLKKGWHPRTD